MTINTLNIEELELLAAGYVLDDLDEAEMAQVEQLIQSSPTMREQIRQSLAVMGILATDIPPISPPIELKDKITRTFDSEKIIFESEKLPVISPEKTIINLENWLQEIFESGWQMATELLGTSTLAPAFRNSGVEGGRLISIGRDNQPIILIVRVIDSSPLERDVVVEILPQSKQEYLPKGLELILLDSDENTVMEATTRQENNNLKFDFTGTPGEAFSIKLKLFNNCFQQYFIL